jgi:site-specific DNA-adenine methylase
MPKAIAALNYFGGKVALARHYPKPKYGRIVEPFAGGAGYSLWHWRRAVTLYDVDPTVIAAWRYLIETDPHEVDRLPLLEPGQDVRDLDISEGARALLSWCVQRATTQRFRLSDWARSVGDSVASFWGAPRRRRVAIISSRVKHWQAICADYREAPNDAATWFVDPPYQKGGQQYRHNEVDYAALGEWCRARRGQVIVCERSGADWLPFLPFKVGRTMSRDKIVEAAWTNSGSWP